MLLSIDKIVSFWLKVMKARFTGKIHFTLDKGCIVDCVHEEKQDVAQFK